MFEALTQGFERQFGRKSGYVFSSPGRTELGGNHTDHQHGLILAAAIDLETTAAVAGSDAREIRVFSDGFGLCTVSLDELDKRPDEVGTTAALVRGVAAGFALRGCDVRGFDAYVMSDVLPGSGLSSSAAFENLIGRIISELSCFDTDAVTLAQISRFAENEYFGKPCGLMDQLASAYGGVISVDFSEERPAVTRLGLDLHAQGYDLCVIDSGADHAGLTDEYAAITEELSGVCAQFGKKYLRDVPEKEFYERLPELREKCCGRALLRAMHVYDENRRVIQQTEALSSGNIDGFLELVSESGRSSWMYLQNVVPTSSPKEQRLAYALACAERLLIPRGVCRVHGGGFAGTIQVYVPTEMTGDFREKMECLVGAGCCHVLSINPNGSRLVTKL